MSAFAAVGLIIGLTASCATSARLESGATESDATESGATKQSSDGAPASFSLKDASGQLQTLESIRGNGRLVVVFYRGQW